MARNVFITTLGTGAYTMCKYRFQDMGIESRFAQVASLQIDPKLWQENDAIIVLATQKAKNANWEYAAQKNPESSVKLPGLKKEIEQLGYKASLQIIDIPDGNTDDELWEIFKKCNEVICREDRLYIDITHAFRYQPMLLLVLSNYLKYIKNADTRAVYYGNYEGRTEENDEVIAPIRSLTPLLELQDWTLAAADFTENGNAEKIEQLINRKKAEFIKASDKRQTTYIDLGKLGQAIKKITDDIKFCKGKEIINAKDIKKAKESCNALKKDMDPISPFNEIFKYIETELDQFNSEWDVQNMISAANFAVRNGLYQQAFTLLNEGFIAYIINSTKGIDKNKILDERYQQYVKYVLKKDKKESDLQDYDAMEIAEIKKIEANPLTHGSEVKNKFASLRDFRNEINHAALKEKDVAGNKALVKNIKKLLQFFNSHVSTTTHPKETDIHVYEPNKTNRIFVNLTNHPSERWEKKQIEESEKFGHIIDIPFPIVDPLADEKEVAKIADEIEKKIDSIKKQYNACEITIHLMGEMTLSLNLAQRCKSKGIRCLASTTNRNAVEDGDTKITKFNFVKYREY